MLPVRLPTLVDFPGERPKLHDHAERQCRMLRKRGDGITPVPVTSVAFSADGERVFSASADNTVKVWDADEGTETLSPK